MGNETPATVVVTNAVAFDIAKTKFLRPELGELLAGIKPQTGEDRAAMTVPISPTESPDNSTVFEAPGDPGERFYLPSYRIATVRTGAGEEFRVRVSKGAAGATLEIILEPFVPQDVLQSAPEAQPLPHSLSAVLVFEPAELAGVRRELPFTEVQDVDGGTRIALTVTAATEISDLFWALTRPENRSRLLVRRLIDVGLPVTITRERPQPPRIDVVATDVAPIIVDNNLKIDPRIIKLDPLIVFQPGLPRDPLFDPARIATDAMTAPTFREADALRSPFHRFGDLGLIREGPFLKPLPSPQPGSPGPHTPDIASELETVVLYRRTTRSIEMVPAPQPFVFNPDIDHVFEGIGASGSPGALVLDQIEFGGAFHSYYRSSARPEIAYYLPDAFKLARLPERPRAPFMSVRFDSTDGTVEQTTATVVIAAAAWTNPDRLAHAARRIAANANPGEPHATVDLQPMLADSARLTLRMALPGEAAQPMPGAVIDLRSVLRVGFELPLGRFQRLFDALQGGGAAMLGGEVEVRMDHPDRPAEKVPFYARFDDLAGPAVDVAVEPRPAGDGFDAVLQNAVESPLRVVDVRASVAGAPVEVEGIPEPDAPPLAAAKSLAVHLSASDRPDVEADIVVLPDQDAIWDAICDETTSFLQREILVRAPAVVFAEPQGVFSVAVEIGAPAGGLTTTVILEPPDLEVKAIVPLPFGDVVLRREDAGAYRYRITAARADRQTVSAWKSATSGVLFVVTGDLS